MSTLPPLNAERLRRRHGYQFRTARPSLIPAICEDAGMRLRPLARRPLTSGHLIGDCPKCGAEDAFFVEPGEQEFMTICGCGGRGGPYRLWTFLIERTRP